MRNNYDKEWLEQACRESFSYAEVLKKANVIVAGGNYETLKKYIRLYDIDISHFTGKLWNKGKTRQQDERIPSQEKYNDESMFTKNSFITRRVLRTYILRHNSIEYVCAFCGNRGIWLDKEIALELDHIDGDPTNNTIENLRFLCPNCHATTSTYRGKNIKNTH